MQDISAREILKSKWRCFKLPSLTLLDEAGRPRSVFTLPPEITATRYKPNLILWQTLEVHHGANVTIAGCSGQNALVQKADPCTQVFTVEDFMATSTNRLARPQDIRHEG